MKTAKISVMIFVFGLGVAVPAGLDTVLMEFESDSSNEPVDSPSFQLLPAPRPEIFFPRDGPFTT
jgi:hypothetical protein